MFSVIIPTYNRGESLDKALKCLFDQTLENFEILVVDDGSNDNAKEVVENNQKNFSHLYYFHQKNKGPSSARNLGARNSSRDYLIFLDSDDFVYRNWIAEFNNLINGTMDFVSCGYAVCENGNKFTRTPSRRGPLMKHNVLNYLAGTFAIRKKHFFEISGDFFK